MRLNSIKNNVRITICFCFIITVIFIIAGCEANTKITREDFLDTLPKLCRNKFQAYVTCKAVGDTVWAYLPYADPRNGRAGTKEKEENLLIEYRIASFNPYRIIEPPELKYLTQKVLREIRALELRCINPYNFFVLVVTDIKNPKNVSEQWYIGYFKDLEKYRVCLDFSGEGYSRLVWSDEEIKQNAEDSPDDAVSPSFRDITGVHIDYHDILLKEFVEKQIKWRIYKRFTIEYNRIPFDLTADEKREEIFKLVKTVLLAYNFKEWREIYFKDSSFLEEEKEFSSYLREYIEKYDTKGITRKPAF